METIYSMIDTINKILWGPWTLWTLLACGILFTLWTKFSQITVLTHGIQVLKGKYDNPDDPGAINHFQALSAALSATVGLGNIGGVAMAIGAGGPGALFWMWVVGFLGMAFKTVEITLAMKYRNTQDPDNPHGGSMWVIDKVLGSKGGIYKTIAKIIGIFFCLTLILSTFTGGNLYQSWSVAQLTQTYFEVPHIATGIVLSILVGVVIIGGIKRIGAIAGKLVPFMCILYLLAAFTVLAANATQIPALFALIFKSAFSPTQASGAFVGGLLGYVFLQGMQRAFFSNEAGQGSAPIAHAAAKTSQPAREGFVGGLGPFIDTICICTITALVILSTGAWNREPIGDFKQKITFTHKNQNKKTDHEIWQVNASSDPSNLPKNKYGKWKTGDKLFTIATVKTKNNKTNKNTGTNKIRITGKIISKPGKTEDAKTTDIIQWDPIKLAHANWPEKPQKIELEHPGIFKKYENAVLTGHAFDRQFPGLGKWLVTIAAWLFAISTMISWSYYGEQGVIYIFGQKLVLLYKIIFLVAVIWATQIQNISQMERFMNLGLGAMLWANIPIILCLGYLAVNSLNTYREKLKKGEFQKYK